MNVWLRLSSIKVYLRFLSSMSNIVKASVIQCSTVRYDLDATLDKMDRLVAVAKERDGSQLAVFPEALSVDLLDSESSCKADIRTVSGGIPKD